MGEAESPDGRGAGASETVADAFLGGALCLRQPRKGHRAGTDAVLLAAAAPADFSGFALDIGAGVGAAGLALAIKRPQARLGLVENDPATATLAQENLALNGLLERGSLHVADVLSPASRRATGLRDESADLVITNPPFYDPGRVRASPDTGKRRAHVMETSGGAGPGGLIAAWIAACLALTAPGGIFIMIHRPDRLAESLAACAGRAGALTIMPVHAEPESAANRILLRGKKGSRAPLSIAPALILNEHGRFTAKADAIHKGKALIDW